MKNGWLAFSLLAAACAGAVARPVLFPSAGADAPAERCEWRYLADGSGPELPEGMDNRPMSAEWAALSQAGYRLAAGASGLYVFERCVPAK